MRGVRRRHSPGSEHLVAATPSLAVLRVGDFGVRTEASLRVAAPVDAAAGVGDIELAPRVDEHLLTSEQTAVFLGNSNAADIVGHNEPPTLWRRPEQRVSPRRARAGLYT